MLQNELLAQATSWKQNESVQQNTVVRKPRFFRNFRKIASLLYSGNTFVAFDTETTGLSCAKDHLLEIGAVKFNKDGLIGEPFDILIKPPVLIPPYITEINHIDNQMVSDCPPIEEALQQFLAYIGNKKTILLAHNAPFDMGFVNTSLVRANNTELRNQVIDTLPLARWAYPLLSKESEKGQYKLQSLAKRFKIDVQNAHRAYDDARVCMELFNRIIKDTLSVQKDLPD